MKKQDEKVSWEVNLVYQIKELDFYIVGGREGIGKFFQESTASRVLLYKGHCHSTC